VRFFQRFAQDFLKNSQAFLTWLASARHQQYFDIFLYLLLEVSIFCYILLEVAIN